MTISVLTKRDQIRAVPGRFLKAYSRSMTEGSWVAGKTRAQLYGDLLRLDTETCSQQDITDILHRDWAALECDECGVDSDALVQIGDEPDYEARWQDLCAGCLADAVNALGKVAA